MGASVLRTLVFYTILVVLIRLLGKRQLGEMEPSEFVVTMLISNLAAIPIENLDQSVFNGILPLILVFALEWIMSVLTLRSIRIRRLFCGKPVILMENGKIMEENLRRTRVNLDEITMHLREQGVFDLSTVKYVILETNGQLSIMHYAKDIPPSAGDAGLKVKENYLPITLISDGRIIRDNLRLTSHDDAWLEKELKKRKVREDQVLLFTIDEAEQIYFVKKQSAKKT